MSQRRKMGASRLENGCFTKICLLGDMGVGKTSLVIRYVHDDFFDRYRPTFSVNHFIKVIEKGGCTHTLMIWDTAGTACFKALTSHYMRDASSVILVFDVTQKESFDNIAKYWLPKIEQWRPGCPVILVANKVDEVEQQGWAVSLKEILQFCETNDLEFIEASAKTGQNVKKCFETAGKVEEVPGFLDDWVDLTDSFQLVEEEVRKDKKPCKLSVLKCCTIL